MSTVGKTIYWSFVTVATIMMLADGDAGAAFTFAGAMAVIYALIQRSKKKKRAAGQGNVVVVDPDNRAPTPRRDDHLAPRPTGSPIPPWMSRPYEWTQVAGSRYRIPAVLAVLRRTPKEDDRQSLDVDVALIADPTNPHDRSAVAVWANDQHVGYLPREIAPTWHAICAAFADRDLHLVLRGRVTASYVTFRPSNEPYVDAYVYLPEPTRVAPRNGIPDQPAALLPEKGSIKVTRTNEHLDVLGPIADPEGVALAVTLHPIHEIRPRSAYEAVEVHVDGQRVGVLTKLQSERLLPLVKHFAERGRLTVARAILEGNNISAELKLNTIHASDADQQWLDSFGPVTTHVKPAQRRPEFEWDDDLDEPSAAVE